MKSWLHIPVALVFVTSTLGVVQAQSVISARSGLVHYVEGEVQQAGKTIAPKRSEFPRLEEGQTLTTKEGRAEVLLTPGVFLRLAENSEVRLDSASLSDTRVEVLGGEALVEVGEMEKGNSVVVTEGSSRIEFHKKGLFRISASPAVVQAMDGEAVVVSGDQTLTLKEGKETQLGGVLQAEKFDKNATDSFYRWASRRAGYLASANLAAAKSVHDSGMSFTRSSWFFNSMLGMYTFLPGMYNYSSPFGYSYFSPGRVPMYFYRPVQAWGGGGGGNQMGGLGMGGGARSAWAGNNGGMRGGSSGYSGGGYHSAAPAAAAPAMSAPAGGGGRSDGGGGSRGGGGHR